MNTEPDSNTDVQALLRRVGELEARAQTIAPILAATLAFALIFSASLVFFGYRLNSSMTEMTEGIQTMNGSVKEMGETVAKLDASIERLSREMQEFSRALRDLDRSTQALQRDVKEVHRELDKNLPPQH